MLERELLNVYLKRGNLILSHETCHKYTEMFILVKNLTEVTHWGASAGNLLR